MRKVFLCGSEIVLMGLVAFAGTMFYHGAASGEAAGCANNKCKQIRYYHVCRTPFFYVTELSDCFNCKTSGRCDGGNNDPCVDTETPLRRAPVYNGMRVCDCKPGITWVEASGSMIGSYSPYTTRHVCQGS